MYQEKTKQYAAIGMGYYVLYLIGFLIMGVLYAQNVKWYSGVYISLFILAVAVVVIRDKSLVNIGITKSKLKENIAISAGIVIITVGVGIAISEYPLTTLIKAALFYLFYISTVEEVVFRGFIQNYLFGLKMNKYLIFALGGLFFSLMHIPFQYYLSGVSFSEYILYSYPQLIFTFVFHLAMCFVAYVRKDIIVPIGLHFAWDFVANVLM